MWARSSPAEHVRDRPGGSLPRPGTSFVGRDRELALARKLLKQNRLLTLTGPGGSGKTRLAIQLASEVGGDFRDGVFFVSLAPLRDPDLVVASIAEVLGLSDISGRSLADRLIGHLRHRQALLVLDNFEHVLSAAGIVARLLVAAEDARIIITSRAPLHLSAEQQCPVPPLALPDLGGAPAAMAESDSVRLFSERAAGVLPEFALDGANLQAAARIATRLDGLPLAIELAAARVKIMPPASILVRLENALGFLVGGARDAPDRQQTLRAAIAWSYELLTPAARSLLAAWSVFRGGADITSVERVCRRSLDLHVPVLEVTHELVDHSLLRPLPSATGARFMILETIREFAAERLAEMPEASLVRDAHAATFAVLAQKAAPELSGPLEKEWLDRLDLEHNNLRGALDQLQASSPVAALEMANALFWFWSVRGHFAEGLTRLLDCLARAPDPNPMRVAALSGAGWLSIDLGDGEGAARLLDEVVGLAERIGDRAGQGRALAFLARASLWRLELERAAQIAAKAVAHLRELDARPALAQAVMYAGLAAQFSGRGTDACAHFQEVRRICQELGWRSIWARGSINLGDILLDLGDLKGARKALSEALPVSLELGDRYVIPIALYGFAGLAAKTERPRLGLRLQGAAEAVAEAGQFAIPRPMRSLHERWLAAARKQMGRRAERLVDEGRRLSVEQAVGLAIANPPEDSAGPGPHPGLSQREREVAGLVASGLTNREVAARLHLSARTIDVHVDHILTKLGFHSRTHWPPGPMRKDCSRQKIRSRYAILQMPEQVALVHAARHEKEKQRTRLSGTRRRRRPDRPGPGLRTPHSGH